MPDADEGDNYSFTPIVSGGSGNYTIALASGTSLPTGLNLSASGVISGVPTVTGSFRIQLTATDNQLNNNQGNPLYGQFTYNLIINTALVLNSSFPIAYETVNYSAPVLISGGSGDYRVRVTSGDTPPDLDLNYNNAESEYNLSGQPIREGIYTFTLTATDLDNSKLTGSETYTMTLSQVPTTTTFTATPSPAVYGQPVTLSATVASTVSGAITPDGSVKFFDGTTLLHKSSLHNGFATFISTSGLAVGSHSITAVYMPDAVHSSSTASAQIEQVNQAPTGTVLFSSQNPANYQTVLTFTATVTATGSGAGTPTGSVTFYDGTAPLQVIPLVGDSATFTTSTLDAGTHSITAVYSGDGNFTTSTSSAVSEVVNSSGTAATVQSVVINEGQAAQNGGYNQRSRVTTLTVTFSTEVDITASQNAFTLTRASDGATIGTITVNTSIVNDQTVAVLTFSGANTEATSLADGNWTLSINAADVLNQGTPMAANYSMGNIKRLFGDIEGTGVVDSTDLGIFGTTFGLTSSNPAFIEGFDSDGNGVIDSTDLGRFGTNFGLTI